MTQVFRLTFRMQKLRLTLTVLAAGVLVADPSWPVVLISPLWLAVDAAWFVHIWRYRLVIDDASLEVRHFRCWRRFPSDSVVTHEHSRMFFVDLRTAVVRHPTVGRTRIALHMFSAADEELVANAVQRTFREKTTGSRLK
jgi:hypothetical protein